MSWGGSRRETPYSEEARAAALRSSGLYPKAALSVQQQIYKIKKNATKIKDLNVFAQRRQLRQDRHLSKLDMDHMAELLRERRAPALRGENARVAGLRQTMEELNSQLQ